MSQILLLNAHVRENTATAMDAKWDESKHPRKHGQFAPKGTGTVGKKGNANGAEGKSDDKEKRISRERKATGCTRATAKRRIEKEDAEERKLKQGTRNGWKKWLTSKEDSSSKGGGAKGRRPAQALAKWLADNKKDVSDRQFSNMLEWVDRFGKSPAGAYKSVMG